MTTLRTPKNPSGPVDVTVVSLDQTGTDRLASVDQASAATLVTGKPVREFRMRKGQKHWSGSWWCSTTADLETYESRLELARLSLADHDPRVTDILSQPFTLHATVDGQRRRHVPDFLLTRTGQRPLIVDVKLASRIDAPKIAPVLAWTRQAVEARGWEYEVWTGTGHIRLVNIRFLAGYRLPGRVNPDVATLARAQCLPGMTVGEALAVLDGFAHPVLSKPALLHLLWTSALTVDLDEPVTRRSLLLHGTRR